MVGVGRATGRREDRRLLTGRGQYVGDIQLDGMAHTVFVRSPHAHAAIRSIDASAATGMPGVVAVYTAADLAADGMQDLPCGVTMKRRDGSEAFQARRPLLARDRVRYAGEAVAMVIAESVGQAQAAAEAVVVDYDDLPVVGTPDIALAPSAPLVWPEVTDNIAYVWQKGDTAAVDRALASSAHVVRLQSHVTRVNANSMEPRGCVGATDASGRPMIYASHQSPHQLRGFLAGQFGVPPEGIRVVARDVGGSFGMKSGVSLEEVLVVWAARKLNRPVKWISERVEGFLTDDHGRAVTLDSALGVDASGRIQALKVDFTIDIGCYLTGRSLFMINNIGGIAGVYRIPHIAASVQGVFTNTQTVAPYRGAGRPEATYVIERLLDLAALELGADPFELRRQNLIPPEAMPYDTGFVFTYDCGEFEGNMDGVAKLADFAGFAKRRAESQARGKLRGMGLANPIEVAGGPYLKPGKDNTRLQVSADGALTFHAGSMSTGQGHETTFVQMISERLGITSESISFASGDTDSLPWGRGNGGSGAMTTGGSATLQVLDKIIESGKAAASDMLEASAGDLEFRDGRYRIVGTDRSVGFIEAAKAAAAKGAPLDESSEFQPAKVTYPNGSHMCEVEVDPETGQVEIVRYSIVEDLGTIINHQLAMGQMHGGIAQGVGQALGERLVHDPETGQLLTASFMDYVMPRADDFPEFDIENRSVPTKVNPLGVKGVGEAGTVGSLVATINAICDALKPLGVTHIEMPATPDRVWEAIQRAKV